MLGEIQTRSPQRIEANDIILGIFQIDILAFFLMQFYNTFLCESNIVNEFGLRINNS